MDNTENSNDLWNEIPAVAFMALGRRGREQISLHQCFVPGCNEIHEENLIIHKKEVEEPNPPDNSKKSQKIYYLIECKTCTKKFQLVFERFGGALTKESGDEIDSDEDIDEEVLFENVYATDEAGKENYGQIGFVQFQ